MSEMNKILEKESCNWYLVFTAPHAEKKVKHFLDTESIENYLPLKKRSYIWQSQTKELIVPLLSRCIFIKICPGVKEKLAKLEGIILPANLDDFRVEDEQIDNLRILFNNKVNNAVLWLTQPSDSGVPARVVSGIYKGLIGEWLDKEVSCLIVPFLFIGSFGVVIPENQIEKL